MAYHVKVTARADRNLKSIFQRIQAQYSLQANKWFNGLETAIVSLTEYPDRGAITPENSRLRQLAYGNPPHIYRIIYHVSEQNKQVSVLHIRHSARDNDRKL